MGAGAPIREFLFVDDLADACVFVMQHYSAEEPVNIGTGEDMTIGDFARLVADIVGYKGRIVFDKSKPDGTPRKVLDVSRLAELGWQSRTSLRKGLERTYQAFLETEEWIGVGVSEWACDKRLEPLTPRCRACRKFNFIPGCR